MSDRPNLEAWIRKTAVRLARASGAHVIQDKNKMEPENRLNSMEVIFNEHTLPIFAEAIVREYKEKGTLYDRD